MFSSETPLSDGERAPHERFGFDESAALKQI
jgi:hypothetical protein